MYAIDFTKRIYCIITGASKGIGRTISIELARRASNNFTLVLLARSEADLNETKKFIESVNSKVNVIITAVDLSNVSAARFDEIISHSYKKTEFDTAVIIHNAGQIGSIAKVSELSDQEVWKNYYNLNFFSVTALNSVFLKKVQGNHNHIFVVNVTSLLGRKPFKYSSMYGSAKAARDLYFKVLAEEEPNLVVLNYSPGMVETSMANELITNIKQFEDSEILAATKANPTKLTPVQTTTKFISLLEKGEFKSGDIIDYYD